MDLGGEGEAGEEVTVKKDLDGDRSAIIVSFLSELSLRPSACLPRSVSRLYAQLEADTVREAFSGAAACASLSLHGFVPGGGDVRDAGDVRVRAPQWPIKYGGASTRCAHAVP